MPLSCHVEVARQKLLISLSINKKLRFDGVRNLSSLAAGFVASEIELFIIDLLVISFELTFFFILARTVQREAKSFSRWKTQLGK